MDKTVKLSAQLPVLGVLEVVEGGYLKMSWELSAVLEGQEDVTQWSCQAAMSGALDCVDVTYGVEGAVFGPTKHRVKTRVEAEELIKGLEDKGEQSLQGLSRLVLGEVVVRELRNFLNLWAAVRHDILLEPLHYGEEVVLAATKGTAGHIAYRAMRESWQAHESVTSAVVSTFFKPRGSEGCPDGALAEAIRMGSAWVYVDDLRLERLRGTPMHTGPTDRIRAAASYAVTYGYGMDYKTFYVVDQEASVLFLLYLCRAFMRMEAKLREGEETELTVRNSSVFASVGARIDQILAVPQGARYVDGDNLRDWRLRTPAEVDEDNEE